MLADLLRVTDAPTPDVVFPAIDEPEVSIVIVTFGTGPILHDALAALARHAGGGPTFEVVVVDNLHPRSQHRTADLLALATSGVRVATPPANLGFGGGNELGISLTRADTLCLLNPDVIVGPGWLPPLVAALREHPDHIVAPCFVDGSGAIDEAGVHIDEHWGYGIRPMHDPVMPAERTAVDYASAACWLLTRALHRRVGGFDPAFHPAYYEDADLALRVERLGGGTLLVPDVPVTHLRSRSTSETVATDAQRAAFLERWAQRVYGVPLAASAASTRRASTS